MSYTPSYDNLTRNVQSLEMGDEIQQVAQVIINYGTDSNGATLYAKHPTTPSITGRTLELTVNTITDYSTAYAIAQNIYGKYHRSTGDDVHEALTITGTELSPLMELGDGVAVNYTNYSDIGNLTVDFSKAMYTDVESQGIPEDDDFPYLSNIADSTTRSFARAKASLQITATEIKSEVTETITGWTSIYEWDDEKTYAKDDSCFLDGSYYKSKANGNLNHQPPDDDYWEEYSESSYVSSAITQSATDILSTVQSNYIAKSGTYTNVASILQEASDMDASITAEVKSSYSKTWTSGTLYLVDAEVSHVESGTTKYYRCILKHTASSSSPSNEPPNSTYWTAIDSPTFNGVYANVDSSIQISLDGISLEYSAVADASAYSSTTNYVKGAIVTYNNKYWQAKYATKGNTPSTSSSYWDEVSATNSSYIKINSGGVQIGGATVTVSNISAGSITAGTLDSDVVYSGYISADQIDAGKIDASNVGVRGLLSIVASDSTGTDHTAGSVGGVYLGSLSYTYLKSSGGNASYMLVENSIGNIAGVTADLFQIQSGIVLSSSAYGQSRTSVSNPQTGQLFFEV